MPMINQLPPKEVYVNDLNGDHFGDIAALTPSYDYNDLSNIIPNVGAVNVTYGTASGIGTKKNVQIILDDDHRQPNAFFGNSAAMGNVDADGFCDILVGAYGASFGGNAGAGLITFVRSKGTGSFEFAKYIGGDRKNEYLGSSTAAGDFNGDGYSDLAAGAIGYKVNGKLNAGAVYTYKGPDLSFTDRWTLASKGIKGSPKAQDYFGSSLFSADINNDHYYDLIIGSSNGNGQKGFVNILYGGPNGLTSKGNQSVHLSNGVRGDYFGFKVGACYCNDDDFADVLITAPGYQKSRGAAFLIDGTANGLSKTSSLFLQNPSGEEGDKFGYSVATIGAPGNFMLAFGSPDAVYNGVKNAGRVDLFDLNHSKWNPFLVGGGNLFGRTFGKSLTFTANYKNYTYFLSSGAPGGTVNGKTGAGFFTEGHLKSIGERLVIANRKTFHLDKLAGDTQAGGEFADGFATYSLMRW
jgi:hypothetical protein